MKLARIVLLVIILLFFALLMISCNKGTYYQDRRTTISPKNTIVLVTVCHEGCEYIASAAGGLIHSPTCPNEAHLEDDEFDSGIKQTKYASR